MTNRVLTTSRKAVTKMTEIIVASADIIIAIFMLLITFGSKQKGLGVYIGIGITAYMYIASAILILTRQQLARMVYVGSIPTLALRIIVIGNP